MENSQDNLETAPASMEYTQFLSELEAISKTEDKIKSCLDFMKCALSKEKTPSFRDFWEAKRLCLTLFKEKILPRVRTILWRDYIELSDAVRKIKEILDKESSFKEEQITLAIKALEEDVALLDKRLEEGGSLELPNDSNVLRANGQRYLEIQKQLELLGTFAKRINGLRKELIQTQMRMRSKNRLFEQLSKLGDLVFPRRKELIQEVSSTFLGDVEGFIKSEEPIGEGPYFILKDEIKALQNFAKALTLDTKTFGKMRERLSTFWDQIKQKETAFRAEKTEKQTRFKEQVLPKFEEIKAACEKGDFSVDQASEKIDALASSDQLDPNEVKALKRAFFETKKRLEEKEYAAKEKQKIAEKLERQGMQKKGEILSKQLLSLIDQAETMPLDILVEKWESFVKEGKAIKIEGLLKALIENRLSAVFDQIQDKKWQEMSEEGGAELTSSLHALLDDRHKEKMKLKERIEEHRKTVGGSALSLEESMLFQELIGEEKLRLDAIETQVEEIEEKLFDIEE